MILDFEQRQFLCRSQHAPRTPFCALVAYLELIPPHIDEVHVHVLPKPADYGYPDCGPVAITWAADKIRASVTFYGLTSDNLDRIELASRSAP